jgi:DNA-binding MurR/RpiR family transcriptional regulator
LDVVLPPHFFKVCCVITNTDEIQSTNAIMKNASALARIRSQRQVLAPAEMNVADWIIKHHEQVVSMSMAQLAQTCGVSDTTVLRFCRAVGFQGYTDLKLALVRDMSSPTQVIHDDISIDDDPATVANKVFASNIQAIRDTLEVLNRDAFQQAVSVLHEAQNHQILIIGVGTSGPLVHILYNMIFRLDFNCRAVTDSYLQLMQVALLGPGDVVVSISQSGSSNDPVLTMEQARKNGVNTICITGNAHSPITAYADIVLLSVSNETRVETIASRIAQLTLIDALYVALSMRNFDIAVKNEQRIWEAVVHKTI